MTLIITQINKYGIIHASDSALTSRRGTSVGEGQKLFGIDYLNAKLTLAGAYSVNGKRMDEWMNDFIARQRDSGEKSLSVFAKKLRDELESNMNGQEKNNSGCIIQIAGYVDDNGIQHPEFWHITNMPNPDPNTGEYGAPSDKFDEEREEFWSDTVTRHHIESGDVVTYINGFTAGRTSYNILSQLLYEFYQVIWNNQNWEFRAPNSIDEYRMLLELNFQTIITLFKISDYSAPIIGGDLQCYIIENPEIKK